MSKLGSKGGKGLGKEGAKCHGKVLQCGSAHQGGINGVLNQEPCASIRACIADAKAELEAEERERDPKRPVG